jgi:hypothetical protein
LRALGVKGILIKAAEQGYMTQLACKMPERFCPRRLEAGYFEPVTDEYSDWSPTHEHFPLSKKDGGHRKGGQRHPRAPSLQSHRLNSRWPLMSLDLILLRLSKRNVASFCA